MDLQDIWCKDVEWVQLAQFRTQLITFKDGLCYTELVGYVIVCLFVCYTLYIAVIHSSGDESRTDGKGPVYSTTYRYNLHP